MATPHLHFRRHDLPYARQTHLPQHLASPTLPASSALLSDLTGLRHSHDDPSLHTKTRRKNSPHKHFHGRDCSVAHQHGTSPRQDDALQASHDQSKLEKAIDTADLSFWTCIVLPNKESRHEDEGYSDLDSETGAEVAELAPPTSDKVASVPPMDDHDKLNTRSSREEYRARLKEAVGYINMRTQLLQELSLGDTIRNESPNQLSLIEGKRSPDNQDKQESDTSFMSGTSIVVKHARRLAGLMHTEEQAISLQDLYQWLQNMGKISGEDMDAVFQTSPFHNQLDCSRNKNMAKVDIPGVHHESRSPFQALQQVQQDVQDRLANLYQGKNFILSHQVEYLTDKRMVLQSEDAAKEETLRNLWEKLQEMEDAYEILGTTIFDNLKEANTLEKEFQGLQHDLEATGCPLMAISQRRKSKKSPHKQKKKAGHAEYDSVNTESSQSESSSALSSSRITLVSTSEGNHGETNVESEQGHFINSESSKKNMQVASKNRGSSALGKQKKTQSLTQKKQKEKQMTEELPVESDLTHTVSYASKGGQQEDKPVHLARDSTEPKTTSVEKDISIPVYSQETNIVVSSASPSEAVPAVAPMQEIGSRDRSIDSGSSPLDLNKNHDSIGKEAESAPILDEVVVGHPDTIDKVSLDERIFNSESSEIPIQDSTLQPHTEKDKDTLRDILSASDMVPLQGLQGLSNVVKLKRKSRRSTSQGIKDQIAQTDDVAILSMDSYRDSLLMQDTTDVKKLLQDVRKLQKQLQFWRTKNWAEKHHACGQMMPAPGFSSRNQFTRSNVPSEKGLVFYYNPQTGFHTMLNASDLDTSMQAFIMELAAQSWHSTQMSPLTQKWGNTIPKDRAVVGGSESPGNSEAKSSSLVAIPPPNSAPAAVPEHSGQHINIIQK